MPHPFDKRICINGIVEGKAAKGMGDLDRLKVGTPTGATRTMMPAAQAL